jgi:hypothetical protein
VWTNWAGFLEACDYFPIDFIHEPLSFCVFTLYSLSVINHKVIIYWVLWVLVLNCQHWGGLGDSPPTPHTYTHIHICITTHAYSHTYSEVKETLAIKKSIGFSRLFFSIFFSLLTWYILLKEFLSSITPHILSSWLLCHFPILEYFFVSLTVISKLPIWVFLLLLVL